MSLPYVNFTRFSRANKIIGLFCYWRGIALKGTPKVRCAIPMPQSRVISWMYFLKSVPKGLQISSMSKPVPVHQ